MLNRCVVLINALLPEGQHEIGLNPTGMLSSRLGRRATGPAVCISASEKRRTDPERAEFGRPLSAAHQSGSGSMRQRAGAGYSHTRPPGLMRSPKTLAAIRSFGKKIKKVTAE